MSISKDKIVIVDLESTCWEGYDAPPGQENEIIEIGICLLDPHAGTIEEPRGILVKPTRSVISPFCTQLTTITPELVEREGIDFEEAVGLVERIYGSRGRLWASWGAYDRSMFFNQCKRRDVRYPFSKYHANLKRVFADHHGERMGMARALEVTGLGLEGTPHRGGDDAYNTARLLLYLVQTYGINVLRRYGF